jgi:hypothetical protein
METCDLDGVNFPRPFLVRRPITLSLITWLVGFHKEVYDADDYFGEMGVEICRTGRDMPGRIDIERTQVLTLKVAS